MPSVENEKEKRLKEQMQKIVKLMIQICGRDNILDSSLELEQEEYETYDCLREDLIAVIGGIVRLQEKPFDFTSLRQEVRDEEFWNEIEEEVDRFVKRFFIVVPYRKLDEHTRLELLEKSFRIIYLERENRKYLTKALEDPQLSQAVYEILRESEFMIVNNYVSKRIYKDFLEQNLKLEQTDMDFLWNLYEHDFSTVMRYVFLKTNSGMMRQLVQLNKKVDDLEDLIYEIDVRKEFEEED